MKAKYHFLILAFLSMFLGLTVGYLMESLAIQLLTNSLSLIILFLTDPNNSFGFNMGKENTPIEEEVLKEVDDCNKKEKPANRDFALVIAVLVSSMVGGGIVLFRQDIPLALFTGVVLYVLIFKYREIKEFFTKKMMRFFNTE